MLDHELDELRRVRDELRVKLELGKLELRDRWEQLEKRWGQLEGHMQRIEEGAKDDWEDVRAAAKLLAEEIREGYSHLREKM